MNLSEPGSHRRQLEVRRASALLYGVALALLVGGCASRSAYPLHLRHRAEAAPVRSSAGALELRILTFNVWGLPAWINGASPNRYGRIARELEFLDPDVVLLQEVWTRRAVGVVPRQPTWSVATSTGQTAFFRRNGLMVMSRFPIVGGEFHPFRTAAFPDSLVRKGALKITLELPDARRINVWNAHLQAGDAPAVRRRQIDRLLQWVHSARDGQVADVVGGDFNCTPDSVEFETLTRELGPTVNQVSQSGHFPTYDGLSLRPEAARTLDYIFIRARSGVAPSCARPRVAFAAEDPAARLSDHLGLQVSVRLTPPPDSFDPISPAQTALARFSPPGPGAN